jgi:hypothetical protein
VAAPPLVRAASSRDIAQLRAAIAKARDDISARAMIAASGVAWQAGLALLVKAGGDLNGVYRNYRSIYALIQEDPHKGGTSSSERVACLEWMLSHGADPELPGAWPAARGLVIAAFQGEWAYVDALRDAKATINVFTAAALGDDRKVASFIKRDSSLATSKDVGGGLTALHCAAGSRLGKTRPKVEASLLACARHLLDAGADPNALARSWSHDVSVAYFAIRSRQAPLLTCLLDRGADPRNAMPTAAWDGQWDVVDLLRDRGVALDAVRDGDRPLLNNLVRWGQFQQARALVERGASPNIADASGWTAMHQAASRGNAGIWQALLSAGGNPDARDTRGRTPLEVARAKTFVRTAKAALQSL